MMKMKSEEYEELVPMFELMKELADDSAQKAHEARLHRF